MISHTSRPLPRLILGAALSLAASTSTAAAQAVQSRSMFDVTEATIPQMQAALTAGRVTSRELVLAYLARIAMYDHTLNAVIAISPTALAEADALDRERAAGHVRGPLHGIPVALKDNIHTTNIPTTGGALAFKGLVPPYEATLTKNLKDAGAIIIAKTVLTELANWVAGSPTPMPGNYSAVGGYGMNPYDPRPDPRPAFNDGRAVMGTGGSSSGIEHRREFLGGERWHRNFRLGAQSLESEHARRHQADGRAHQPLRGHPDHRRSGHSGPDGAHSGRRGHHARRAGEPRACIQTIRRRASASRRQIAIIVRI